MPAAYSVPALIQLLDEIDELAPDRDRSSDGWIGDADHASRLSDHNPEPDGSVDARDFTHDPANGADMHKIAEKIRKDPRALGHGYIIFDGRQTDDDGEWVEYNGSNAHRQHMHVSVRDELQNDTSPWLEEEGLTMANIEELLDAEHDTRKLMLQLAIAEEKRDRLRTRGDWRRHADLLEALGQPRPTDEPTGKPSARETAMRLELDKLGGQPLPGDEED